MIVLIVTACLTVQPSNCIDIHTPTPFGTVIQCEQQSLLLIAGVMISLPERRATWFVCEDAGLDT